MSLVLKPKTPRRVYLVPLTNFQIRENIRREFKELLKRSDNEADTCLAQLHEVRREKSMRGIWR